MKIKREVVYCDCCGEKFNEHGLTNIITLINNNDKIILKKDICDTCLEEILKRYRELHNQYNNSEVGKILNTKNIDEEQVDIITSISENLL